MNSKTENIHLTVSSERKRVNSCFLEFIEGCLKPFKLAHEQMQSLCPGVRIDRLMGAHLHGLA